MFDAIDSVGVDVAIGGSPGGAKGEDSHDIGGCESGECGYDKSGKDADQVMQGLFPTE